MSFVSARREALAAQNSAAAGGVSVSATTQLSAHAVVNMIAASWGRSQP